MALLFFDGFEGLNNRTQAAFRYDLIGGQVSFTTTGNPGPLSGTMLTGASTFGSSNWMWQKYFEPKSEIVVGMRRMQGQLNSDFSTYLAGTSEFCLFAICDQFVNHLMVNIKFPDLKIYIRRGGTFGNATNVASGTLIAESSANAFTLSQWNYIELKAVASDTVGSVELKVNGVTIINQTGLDTIQEGGTNFYSELIGADATPNSVTAAYFDDVYICDTTGSSPYNNFLGDVRVFEILPNAEGDSTQFTPLSGSNFAAVDDSPGNDSDTSYVQSSTAGHLDLYNLSTPVTSATNVLGVKTVTVAQKTSLGAQELELVIKSGTTSSTSTANSLINNYREYSYTLLQNPDTTSNWTVSDLTNLQAGFKLPDA
jgi:hypothetical protein